ncbi:glycosyltransferase family 2 protein [Paraliobacillus zengyii]|uniref:glycosyltransferase family 2 protein n=1 Tax=Paraliobacillus zengyii TaxID=2213194 RepID=UPI000E3EB43D|nr:glycosyltransferase family A protein [Paraliobacillus zengyii]
MNYNTKSNNTEEKSRLENIFFQSEKQLKNELEKEKKANEDLNKLKFEYKTLREQYNKELSNKKREKAKLEQIKKSKSWKIADPVRKVILLTKKFNKVNQKATSTVAQESTLVNKNNKEEIKLLNTKLFGGFSKYAYEELVSIKESPTRSINEKVRVAWILARWFYDKEEYEKAHEEIQFIKSHKKSRFNVEDLIREIKVLKKIGEDKLALHHLWEAIDVFGLKTEIILGMAHLIEDREERVKWLNLIYEKHGHSKIQKIDSNKPFAIDNICSPLSEVEEDLNIYKISIIIPAYNASESIHIALDSLLAQSVRNIEIIVVDDCSKDNTTTVVEAYAKKDDRVKLISKDINEGAYAARNTALQVVTGDYITIHDSDDWSHPQKLEIQLKEILNNPHAVGSVSYLVRTYEDLFPLNAGSFLSIKFLMMNSSSLLVDKNVILTLGGWDSVRVAGDTEFLWRIEKAFGKESIIRAKPEVPFSFALSSKNSLTGRSMTNVKTIMFGLRRTYRESFQWWHDSVHSNQDLYMDPSISNRKFPCPVPNLIDKPERNNYDIIFVSDFTLDKNNQLLLELIKIGIEKEMKIGIFHWPDYRKDTTVPMSDHIYYLALENNIDLLVAKENLDTEILIVGASHILDYELDGGPKISAVESYIIDEEKVNSSVMETRTEHLERVFGIKGNWIELEELKQKKF